MNLTKQACFNKFVYLYSHQKYRGKMSFKNKHFFYKYRLVCQAETWVISY